MNKADRPGADVFARELEAALEIDPRAMSAHPPKVFKLSALSGEGVVDFLTEIETARTELARWQPHRLDASRLQAEGRALLMVEAERKVRHEASQIQTPQDLGRIFTGISS